ncbi:acyl-CoA dehydrogenase family protein, partial [Mycolicibacterium sp. S2-37]|uniref:acyl-CoA dehydrogenase family protein n=1 Tax=Mycolicibacterium sp. S2-37 TaxID=2810297 RepID=UPI001A93CA90
MQLTFDRDVEEFRAEFSAFLDENLPPETATLERPRSVSHMPQWARDWQRLLFDNGWLLPAQPPEFGGRNATVLQQFVHLDELCRRRIYHSFNPQGVNIIAASLITFGSDEQKHEWAVPVLRGERTASLGMSEPSAGSDLASLRTRAVRDGSHFVVNGQKVWTSGAHDADFLLTFVRTDPDAPKHKGISVLLIPTDTPGVVCRPFADLCGEENTDFNEVFFTDARVPVENLVGPLNQGWKVANGSLGHERTMMWLGFADRIDNMIADFRPGTEIERDQYASSVMDYQALRAMGSAALARAARGEMDTASVSVLKLFGSEAEMRAADAALTAAGSTGLVHPSTTGRYEHMNLDHYFASWFERYARSFSGTIAGGTSEIQRNIIATQVLGLPRGGGSPPPPPPTIFGWGDRAG